MRNSHFQYWHDEFADIPSQAADGTWVDLETGLPYDPKARYNSTAPRKPVAPSKYADEVKAARADARNMGLAKLTGSTKQKQWAEQIRVDRIKAISDEELKRYAGCHLFSVSKFWIETRKLSAVEIVNIVVMVRDLHKKACELHDKFNDLFPDDVKVGQRAMISNEQSQIANEIKKLNSQIESLTNPPSRYSY